MTKNQIQKHLSYLAGKEINVTYILVWNGDALYSAAVDTFNDNITDIETERDAQANDLTGFTAAKKAKKTSVAKTTARSIGNIVRYAAVNELTEELSNFNKYSENKLLKMQDGALIGVVDIVLQKISSIGLPALLAYKIVADTVTEITTLKNDYIPMIGKPKALKDMKKVHTSNLKKLFKKQDDFIKNQLLTGAANFTEVSSDYVEALTDSLVPDAAATGTMALRILVNTAPDNTALQGVRVEIIGTTITRITSALGQCRIQNLVNGTYVIHCTKTGFSPMDFTIIVDNVNTAEAVITMAHT